MTWEIRQGDCVEAMRAMPEASVDAVVCDPPYGLEFMGKDWDRLASPQHAGVQTAESYGDKGVLRGYGRGGPSAARAEFHRTQSRLMQEWHEAWAREALRVLKPGGHLLAFGGTRTYHRLASGVEDAGFEVRDCIAWMYGSGFPKSLDVSKAIDKSAGHWRGKAGEPSSENGAMSGPNYERTPKGDPVTAAAAAAAAAAAGWGTALKPAYEPIIVARKPLIGTVAANWREHGTGALNIDACRIAGEYDAPVGTEPVMNNQVYGLGLGPHADGRWPANVVLDESAAEALDEQSGTLTSGSESANGLRRNGDKFRTAYGDFAGTEAETGVLYGDSGGASRFFYCAKTSTAERDAGIAERDAGVLSMRRDGSLDGQVTAIRRNAHPTVKPIDLMRWLVRLVTPPDGLILDPFTGSGTTGCAAVLEGFHFIGLEREAEYARIARARITHWSQFPGSATVAALESGRARQEHSASGQASMFDDESLGGVAA